MFFRIFAIIPFIELITFIIVAQIIGWGAAFLCCVISALLGGLLIWRTGLHTLFGAAGSASGDGLNADDIFTGACLALAGVLLIVPGFVTDALAVALIVPRLRHRIWYAVTGIPPGEPLDPGVIEGEFERVEEEKKPLDRDRP